MTTLPEAIDLQIVTPERYVLHETVQSIEMPGKEGYLGILPGHAPLLTELGVGILSYVRGSGTHYLTVMEGYAEVLSDRVIVLAELSERAEEIDLERCRTAAKRARAELAKPGLPEADWKRATYALERAVIRTQAASKVSASAGTHESTESIR